MKILMVLESSFPPDTRVENEAFSLINNGHEVHMLCFKKDNQSEFDNFDGIIIHRIRISKLLYKSSVAALRFPFYFRFWRKNLEKTLIDNNFDLIHIHDLPLASVAYRLKRKYKLKFVLDLHENWPGLLNMTPYTKTIAGRLLCSINKWRKYEEAYVKKADSVIVVVDEFRQRLLSLIPEAKNIHVISNTLNLEKYHLAQNNEEYESKKTVFIYSGGISYHRGIQTVIKAFATLPDLLSETELWIVGKGSYLTDLVKLSSSLGLDQWVKFLGWVSQEEIFRLINKANVGLIPHIRSEQTDAGLPHKLFHYMYSGKPIISSNCVPLKRIISETNCGITYNWDDHLELAGIIKKFIVDKKYRNNFSNGPEYVNSKYNWRTEEKVLLDLYNKLI